MKIHFRPLLILGVLALGLSLGGCMAKARTLHVAVGDFRNESIAAVDAIDAMWRAEIAPPPTTPAAATDAFVEDVLALNTDADDESLATILYPDRISDDEQAILEERWGEFLGDLRLQYVTFASIFDNVERASFTGRDEIARAQPYVEKLTAQLAYFAEAIAKAPPRLLQHRGALIAQLNTLRTSDMPESDKRKQIALWRDSWMAMEAAENDLRDRTIRQCVKAAIVGKTVRDQIVAYGDLTLADLVEAINLGLQLAQSASGNDFAGLRGRVDEITQAIQADPVWSSSVSQVLGQIQTLGTQP
ncbi:MAG TPA: hypothetical protein VG742_15945 [Dongiaceae bacterium]|nr:hypothetical protein [Dongiaceae bacterium]